MLLTYAQSLYVHLQKILLVMKPLVMKPFYVTSYTMAGWSLKTSIALFRPHCAIVLQFCGRPWARSPGAA